MNNTLGANKSFYTLFLVSAIFLFLLLSVLVKIAPLSVSHALYSCKEAIAGFAISLPHSFPLIFAVLLFSFLGLGLLFLAYKVYKTKVFIKKILKNKVIIPKKVQNIALQLHIIDKIDVVQNNTFSSFCYGFFFPRICISLEFVNTLTKKELHAVLIHESYHLKNNDPVKVLLSQVAISLFFFVPVLRDFQKYYALTKEINADKLVIKTNFLNELKSALIKTLDNVNPRMSGIASLSSQNDLQKRVEILMNPEIAVRIGVSRLNVFLSVFMFAAALVILNTPVHAMENKDGTHTFIFVSSLEKHLASCTQENYSSELPFSSLNYSPIISK